MKLHVPLPGKKVWMGWMALMLLFHSLSFGTADANSSSSAASFTATASPASPSVEAGARVIVHVAITATAPADVLVDVEFFDSRLNNVGQAFVDNIKLEAGHAKTVPVTWQVPANLPAGDYTISFGLFGAGWSGSVNEWFPGAAKLTVTGGTGGGTGTPPPPDPKPTDPPPVDPKPTDPPPQEQPAAFGILTSTGGSRYTSSITPTFKVANNGAADVRLNDLTIRYYFTADFAGDEEKALSIGYYSMVKWRSLAATDVLAKFVKMPVPAAQASHYLEVGFTEGAGVIKPEEVLTFSGWMYKSDWSSFDQTNDHSFLDSSAELPSRHTTLYLKGERVWGSEPELLALPSFPDPVHAEATDTSISLSWSEVPGATGYEVYADGNVTAAATAGFVYGFLKPGTAHVFKVRTLKGDSASLWSAPFTVKTSGEQQLPVPIGVRAEKGLNKITLTWRALQEAVTGYEVEVDGTIIPVGRGLTYTHQALEPSTLHTYRVRARDGQTAGPWSDKLKVNTLRTPGEPGEPLEVKLHIDPSAERAPISPFIYGANEDLTGTENLTSRRAGGNRFSAYNWENNASNSGSDEGFVSDSFVPWYYGGIPVSQSGLWEVPGSAAIGFHQKSLEQGAYTLWTLPMAGYAAKDKKLAVHPSETPPSDRWVEVKAAKGAPFELTPDLNDGVAYNDELVNLLVNQFGSASTPTGIKGYSMDNEPGLWNYTHAYMHPEQARGAEVLQKSLDLAKAVKAVDPAAEMFGPVSYGFSDAYMVDNQEEWNEIKGNYRWYLDYYLDNMARESRQAGRRLLDVLDIHWYSEEMGGGTRITSTALESHTLETHKVRVQAPRSLWDPSYREDTWIGQWYSDFLPLLPTMRNSVNTYNPGTKMAITEYDYGGGHHVSGGIAQADTLGIFGKQGLYMAHYWNMAGTARLSQIPYVSSGFRIFNNYDGNGATYGDTSVLAETNDIENSSVYGSVSMDDDGRLHLIVINKNFDQAMNAEFTIAGATAYRTASVWAFDESSPQITQREGLAQIEGNRFTLSIPKLTVAHIVLSANADE